LADVRADLVVLPELANSGYMYAAPSDLVPYTEPGDGTGPFLSALRELAARIGGVIVTGLAERGRDGTASLPSAPGGEGAFFERDEFPSETAVPAAAAVDAEAVEKARRFARIIVSDIALYNQEAVSEGIREGTFYELLQDDIAEGRSVYDKRVSEAIRATGDYLQEAFDKFIASKKKLR
jgi:hypothetical protein